jgi:hypothetical protein
MAEEKNKPGFDFHVKNTKENMNQLKALAKNSQEKQEMLNAVEERRKKDAGRIVPSGGKRIMVRSEKPFFKKEKEDTK